VTPVLLEEYVTLFLMISVVSLNSEKDEIVWSLQPPLAPLVAPDVHAVIWAVFRVSFAVFCSVHRVVIVLSFGFQGWLALLLLSVVFSDMLPGLFPG
jgi:hypothetical protein